MPHQIDALIVSNTKIINSYYLLKLSLPLGLRDFSPGQFLHVKIEGSGILLRRPFSIHRIDHRPQTTDHRNKKTTENNCLEILYEVKGKGTTVLSQKKPGEYLNIIGPLGHGFNYKSQSHKATKSQVLVAGGMGAAPLTFLAEKLVYSPYPGGHRQSTVHRNILVLLGAKTKSHILCEKEFKKLGCEVRIATDDGSKGFKGRVTDLLRQVLDTKTQRHKDTSKKLTTHNSQLTTIYSCGPKPMLKEIARISGEYNIPAQVSLEEFMGCGIGACLGCVVPVSQLASEPVNRQTGRTEGRGLASDGQSHKPANRQTRTYKRICHDGPVFDAKEIVWE